MKLILILAHVLYLSAVNVSAAQITVEHEARGWINLSTGANGRSFEGNYLAGYLYDHAHLGVEFRNWFAFELPTLTANEQVVAAELLIHTRLYDAVDTFETYELRHIAATPGTIGVHDWSTIQSQFADLADGPVYGSRTFSLDDHDLVVSITLNAAALSDINAAAGGLFELGGALTTLGQWAPNEELVFSGSHLPEHFSRLHLTTVVVPEPSTWALMAGAALALLARRRIISCRCDQRRRRCWPPIQASAGDCSYQLCDYMHAPGIV